MVTSLLDRVVSRFLSGRGFLFTMVGCLELATDAQCQQQGEEHRDTALQIGINHQHFEIRFGS